MFVPWPGTVLCPKRVGGGKPTENKPKNLINGAVCGVFLYWDSFAEKVFCKGVPNLAAGTSLKVLLSSWDICFSTWIHEREPSFSVSPWVMKTKTCKDYIFHPAPQSEQTEGLPVIQKHLVFKAKPKRNTQAKGTRVYTGRAPTGSVGGHRQRRETPG